MSGITTHVLDTSRGCPAAGVPITLELHGPREEWQPIGRGVTDDDGRLRTLIDSSAPLVSGTYRLTFDTRAYFAALKTQSFYPKIVVIFDVASEEPHYHVPLLLSPFGYSTYRGS